MPRPLPRTVRLLLPALTLAVLMACGVQAATAHAGITWNITPSVQGAGTVTIYGNQTYECTGPADDRQTADCPTIAGENPGGLWFSMFLIATPPEGDGWTFVRWENCPGAQFSSCSYMGTGPTFTGAPRAIFDDTAGPEITATRTVSQTVERTVSFSLAGGDAAAYECGIDGAQLAPCGATRSYTLAEGAHTFAARGVDASGNKGPTTTVEFRTLDTQLVDGPPAVSSSKTAAFAFSSAGGSSFDCSLDGAAFTACATKDAGTGRGAKTFANLAEGRHTLEVRARHGDEVDPIPVKRTWTVDTVAPATTLDAASGPRQDGLSTGTRESFKFSSNEAGSFECRIDGGAFAPCTSPAATRDLAPGPHSFEVRAVDVAGNRDATPAKRSWTTLRDADRDGFEAARDCDDGNPRVHPGAADTPDNGADENCDGADAVNLDRDGDGIPRPADCDDGNAAIRPGTPDAPGNGADEDCDGRDAQLSKILFSIGYESPHWGRRASRLVTFTVKGLPAGSTVEVICKRCPKPARRVVRRNVKGDVRIKPLLRRIRAGAAIQVRVSKPGMLTTVRTLKVRSGKGPKVTEGCLVPGARKPAACP